MVKAKQTNLFFKSKEVKRCIHHAICSTQWSKFSDLKYNRPTDMLTEPALIIITDYSGTYIMSAGQPRDKLHNKKIYSAYAEGEDYNPLDDLRAGKDSQTLLDVHENSFGRARCIAVVYLSVGENGHCYEEILTEAFDKFIVTITEPVEERVDVMCQTRTKNINHVMANIDMNRDTDTESAANTRRILKEDSAKK
jgi:hypothetical protein